ncbi:MAG TPA: acetate--CoA ligase family protein [bacterium]|nr:acetate--CoA ligase family protein [bacterium]
MAKLYEYQGKEILKKHEIPIPKGAVISTADEAVAAAEKIGWPVVVKIQTWSTGRKAAGGVRFAATADELRKHCGDLLGMKIGNFAVEKLLIEQKLAIAREFFAGFIINDTAQKPMFLFSSRGGSGIEEIAKEYPDAVVTAEVDIFEGMKPYRTLELIKKTGLDPKTASALAPILVKMYEAMRKSDARSFECNPLVMTADEKVYAADCHVVVDDYAVFRHPEFGIEIAREFDRPPTELERIAYMVEKNDYRGTFFFFQMAEAADTKEAVIGFHGAGGGGSMMSMNAVSENGCKIANFCDTSGNPPASKVYRAAKVILSQPGIKGYFSSGSGVASQEQFHSARGFVKAFLEEGLDVPASIRLGGNSEEIAMQIIADFLGGLPVQVKGFGKNDSPDSVMKHLLEGMKKNGNKGHTVKPFVLPDTKKCDYSFQTMTGSIHVERAACAACTTKACIGSCSPKILKEENGAPALAIDPKEAKKGKCIECLACELACMAKGMKALKIVLPIEGLASYREKLTKGK